jgi:Cytochrome c554 and c-prime
MRVAPRKLLAPAIGLGVGLVAVVGVWLFNVVPAPTTSPTPATIELIPMPSVQPDVTGTVVDDGGPVAGTLVRWQTLDVFTHTDREGRFHLPLDPGEHRVTAWKDGYLISSSRNPLEIRLSRLPKQDNEHYQWGYPAAPKLYMRPLGRSTCADCHAEIGREWLDSAHAYSAIDPRFVSFFKGTDSNGRAGQGWSLKDERPLGTGVCAACHAPGLEANEADDFTKLLRDDLKPHDELKTGVHCDFCHKITGVVDGKMGLTHGRFKLKMLRPDFAKGEKQVFFGPLDDADRDNAYSPTYRESRYCASCHEGIVFGVPVYTTYSEWLDSPAGRDGTQCQTCHMRPTGKMTNMAPDFGGHERDPQTLGNHLFFSPDKETMIKQSVRVKADLERQENKVHVTVRLTPADVGHRVPTGFVDRNLVLVVDATDAEDKPLKPSAGPSLPDFAGAEVAGRPGKVYAKLLTDGKGNGPVPFWRDDATPTDNRLTPGQSDEVPFDFPADVNKVRVRVLYRRFWPEVIRAKKGTPEETTVFDQSFAPAGVAGDR